MTTPKVKQTEIGKIPDDWEIEKFGDLVNLTTGRLDSNAEEVNGKYPFFTCAPNPLRINTYAFDCDAILLAGNNANGIFHTNKFNGKFNAYQRTYVLTEKEKIKLSFLYYSLQLYLKHFKEISQGSATKFLTKVIIENIKIGFPKNPSEQSAIASILSSLDAKIELNNKMNKTLEAIGQAIFKKWFIDEKKEDWKEGKLGDLGEFKNGINYLRDENGDTEFSIINVRNISNNKWILSNDLDKINIDSKKAKDYLLNQKDIIIARSACPGKVSLLVGNLNNIIYSGFSIRYRLKDFRFYFYISYVLENLQEKINNFSVGTTLSSINQEVLKNIKTSIPGDKSIEEFNEIISPIFSLISKNCYENQSLSQIRDSLLPKLMSGEIRVPVSSK